jgi:hypothetical protein
MDERSIQEWEYCRIVRAARRVRWWSRRREGAFAAVVAGRPIARSATTPIDSDAEGVAFRALLTQLVEEGWEPWRDPPTGLGIRPFAIGYWDRTLRRRMGRATPAAPTPDESPTREIDLPPVASLPAALLPPGSPVADAGGKPPPTAALPPELLPPGNPVRRRTGR